ncbi:phage tail assembly chaperone [Rhodopseudomonas sp. HC1]|uniref:rcc01693 family protein n=1 Tax=Rhodopseudomonas infernalis TaxID=2897386 RepID=UPI001EE8A989|nr:rcc01693 family protein [Rhodopseudomonas infernalis]MCG6203150.1 phage tail assembly chaperone [Rhodopseudomonas infernalis]
MMPFPWREAMQFGFGTLRLAPDAFWRMTPRELAAALIGARGGVVTPLDRGGLDELMRRYPDNKERAR